MKGARKIIHVAPTVNAKCHIGINDIGWESRFSTKFYRMLGNGVGYAIDGDLHHDERIC